MALHSSAGTIAVLVDAMINAADALMRHQTQAVKVRTKATRTTALSTTSSTRCHTQAVSSCDRSQSRCVEKPSLNAAKTLDEQSVNADVRELEYVCRG